MKMKGAESLSYFVVAYYDSLQLPHLTWGSSKHGSLKLINRSFMIPYDPALKVMQHCLCRCCCQSKLIALVQMISHYLKDVDIVQTVVVVSASPQLQNNVCWLCGNFLHWRSDLLFIFWVELGLWNALLSLISSQLAKYGLQMCLSWPAVWVNIQKSSVKLFEAFGKFRQRS